MVSWLIGGYAAFVMVVGGAAAAVALVVGDRGRREMAYRVLKLVLGTGTGAGGLLAVAARLHEAGLVG